MELIRLRNVEKRYEADGIVVNALREINLTLQAGKFISFIGPSGSGKTTLLNLLGCLDKPTSGTVTVAGVDTGALDRKSAARFRGETIGFIFQNFNLIPVLTAYENVEYPLVMVKKTPPAERKRRVLRLLEEVGMADQRNKFPAQLSGGQKQRIAVARAMVVVPTLVLADEPTANLDHETAFAVMALMRAMKDERNTTFVFATHDPKVVGQAEIVHTLADGRLTAGETHAPEGRGGQSS